MTTTTTTTMTTTRPITLPLAHARGVITGIKSNYIIVGLHKQELYAFYLKKVPYSGKFSRGLIFADYLTAKIKPAK